MKIAAWQALSAPGNVEENLRRLEAAARQAADKGAQLLVTPEMFVTGYNIGAKRMKQLAKSNPLPLIGDIAGDVEIGILAGGPWPEADTYLNTAAAFSDQGELLGRYTKTHLFGDLDRAMFSPGQEPVGLVEYRGLKIAMLICYDVEFPETVRAGVTAGAHLVAVPTAQMEPFDVVNRHVVPTRAWENQVYLAYVNQHGVDGDLTYVGKSLIAAPDGSILASAPREGETLIYADINSDTVEAARQENPYLDDLRTDLF